MNGGIIINYLLIAAYVLECFFVGVFIKTMWPKKNKKSLVFKMISSTMFVATGLLCMSIAANYSKYAILLIIAFALSWVGDFLLHVNSKQKTFITGSCFFAGAHMIFIAAYFVTIKEYNPGKSFFSLLEIAAVVFMLAAFTLYNKSIGLRTGKVSILITLYAVFLATMFVKAVSLSAAAVRYYATSESIYGAILLSIGALSFLLSDLTMMYLLFYEKRKGKYPYKIFNSVTYFLAQMMIASSILYIGK